MKYLYFVLGAGCQIFEQFFNLNETNYFDLLPEFDRMSKIIIDELGLRKGTMKEDEWKERLIELKLSTREHIMATSIDELEKSIVRLIKSKPRGMIKLINPTPNKNQTRFFEKFFSFGDIINMYMFFSNESIPIENIRIKCYNYATSNIVKTYLGITPLKRLTGVGWKKSDVVVSLCREILEKVQTEPNDVIVMGHSYGGAIINRTAKLMSQLLTSDEFKDHHTENINFLGFGSIYIPREPPPGVNLINYLSIGDVAMKTNRLSAEIPSYDTFNKVLSSTPYEDYVCTFRDDNSNEKCYIRWICLFEDDKPLCINNERQRRISMFDWSEHSYGSVISKILDYNDITFYLRGSLFTADIKDFLLFVYNYPPQVVDKVVDQVVDNDENISGGKRRKCKKYSNKIRISNKVKNSRKKQI
jgi:hypothetical protein